MSQRQRKKRTANGSLLNLAEHGKIIGTGRQSELAVAARWMGQDYVITRAVYLPPWRDWPPDGPALRAFFAKWRRGTHEVCMAALQDIGFDFGYERGKPWLPALEPYLESVGICRIVPPRGKFFEKDSRVHWPHAVRDGMYDVWAGMKLDKNGNPIWLGQRADDDSNPDKPIAVPCQYNETRADGHGMALIYRFKAEFVEALPHLLSAS